MILTETVIGELLIITPTLALQREALAGPARAAGWVWAPRPRRRQPAAAMVAAHEHNVRNATGEHVQIPVGTMLAEFAAGCLVQTPTRYRMIEVGVTLLEREFRQPVDLDRAVVACWPRMAMTSVLRGPVAELDAIVARARAELRARPRTLVDAAVAGMEGEQKAWLRRVFAEDRGRG